MHNQAILFLDRTEIILANATHRAHPVGWNVLKGGSSGDATVRVANSGVVDIPADVANVLLHESKMV